MTRFFTSDLHVRHDLVVRERGFGRADGTVDHDAYEAVLADRWDNRVGKDDQVFILGDIAMNPRKGAFDWLAARPGRKVLISGNHDEVHPLHSRWLNALPKWQALGIFEVIASQGSIKIAGQKVLLSHFPYKGEGGRDMEDRHTEWRFRNEGLPLLHGHEHKKNALEVEIPNQFHVGLDSHEAGLVHERTIEDWLDGVHLSSSF